MRSMVPMVEEGKKDSSFSRFFFFLLSRFIATRSHTRSRFSLCVLCASGPTARTEGPLCSNPRLLSLPTPPPAFFYRYFDRTIVRVRSRSRSPKTTTAAAAAENRCRTPYNHIVVSPSPPSPPSPSFVLDVLVHVKLVGTFSQQIT